MSLYLALAAILLAGAGAIGDILTRRLPNALCLVVAVVCAAFAWSQLGLAGLGWSALHALAGLFVGMGLFKAGVIGAGDAKFYTALAFGVPLGDALSMILWMSLGGLGLLVVMAVHRTIAKPAGEGNKGWSVPYGVAIFCGFVGAIMPRLAI